MNRYPWKKWLSTYVVGLLIALYMILVAERYWNWFGVPLLHLPELSYVQTCVITVLVGLFTRVGFPLNYGSDVKNLKMVDVALGLCIPPEKQAVWDEYVREFPVSLEVVGLIFGTLAAQTGLLALGYVLHLAFAV